MRTTNRKTASAMPRNTASTILIAIDRNDTSKATKRSSATTPRCAAPRRKSRAARRVVQGSICRTATTMITADKTVRGR